MSNVEMIRLVLLGGRVDGTELEMRDPGPRVMVPTILGIPAALWDPEARTKPLIGVLEYDLVLVDGWPSIDDEGRRRYRLASTS